MLLATVIGLAWVRAGQSRSRSADWNKFAVKPPGNDTVITILLRDHDRVERIFAALDRSLGATDEPARRDLVDHVITDVVRRGFAEESRIFPRVRELVSAAGAERLLRQQAALGRTMKRLDGMSVDNPMFERLLSVFMDQVREHWGDEELDIFPELERMFSRQELIALGAEVEAAKRFGPTRPHPRAPDRPPVDRLTGPIVGLWDRVRDAVGHRDVGR